ncbi:uncharacterized protein [Macrobrachium rosenbergii]|uniref:uncharacterized protein isoform X2 n=1 Tax=Macrobrachium rosenbergii TaxID=79674 RepID=UPI0034D502BF
MTEDCTSQPWRPYWKIAGQLLVLLPVIALARAEGQCSAEITAKCPAIDPSSPVYYPDPDDCGAYCECSDQIAWRFTCAPQTLYDERLKVCNWEQLVECGDRPRPTSAPATTSQAPSP